MLAAAPAWTTVTVCPAMVTVPVREVVAVFAAIVSVTVPFPPPVAGLTLTHPTADEAVHVQPAPVVTVRAVVLAPASGDTSGEETT